MPIRLGDIMGPLSLLVLGSCNQDPEAQKEQV